MIKLLSVDISLGKRDRLTVRRLQRAGLTRETV
jgi:hypothetical protein